MKKLAYIIFALVFLSACEEYSDGIYKGPDQVGWGKAFQGSLNKYIEDVAVGDDDLDSLEIQLIGRQSSDPITVGFSVATASTAIEGVHFDFVTTGGAVTIAPGTSSAYVYFNAKSDNFSIDEDFNLVLDITSADVQIAPNLATVSHNMSITCQSDLAGIWTAVSSGSSTDGCPANNPLADFAYGPINITAGAVLGQYTIDDSFAGSYIEWYGACYGYTFTTANTILDVCGDLSGSWNSAFGEAGIPVTGSVNGDGTLTLQWTNLFGDQLTSTLTRQ